MIASLMKVCANTLLAGMPTQCRLQNKCKGQLHFVYDFVPSFTIDLKRACQGQPKGRMWPGGPMLPRSDLRNPASNKPQLKQVKSTSLLPPSSSC